MLLTIAIEGCIWILSSLLKRLFGAAPGINARGIALSSHADDCGRSVRLALAIRARFGKEVTSAQGSSFRASLCVGQEAFMVLPAFRKDGWYVRHEEDFEA